MSEAFRQLLKEFPKSSVAAQANYYIGKAAFEAKDYKVAVAPLDIARQLNKEQYYNPATLRIVSSFFYLKDRPALSKEVDAFVAANPESKNSGGHPRMAWPRVLQRKKLRGRGKIPDASGQVRQSGQRKTRFLVLSRRRADETEEFRRGRVRLRKISAGGDRSGGESENITCSRRKRRFPRTSRMRRKRSLKKS